MINVKKPNIILIMTDQQRYDTVQALGYPHMKTPNIDRLVREGMAFNRCYCTAPSCVPSRASFFNGCYPHTLNVYHNFCNWEHSWVELLNEAGYHCANIGKMHTLPYETACGFDERFVVENKDRPLESEKPHGGYYDEWDKFLANSGVRKPSRESYRAEHPEYNSSLGAYKWPLEEKYHSDEFVGNMAKWFIERRKSDSPFFLQIGFPGPHPPYDPVERFIELYNEVEIPVPIATEEEFALQPGAQALYRKEMIDGNHDAVKWLEKPSHEQLQRLRRYYAASVTQIDEKIGEILNLLEKQGYLEDAIVIFTSDHGDCLGDHGHIQKWTMYESVVHVPMIVWSPGRMPAGEKSEALLQHMDIAATILEMAGIDIPRDWEAISVADDLLSGREYVFAEHARDNILKGVDFITMVRSEDMKLVHYLDQECGELYDLRKDPDEKVNLWDNCSYSVVKKKLLNEILNWRVRGSVKNI